MNDKRHRRRAVALLAVLAMAAACSSGHSRTGATGAAPEVVATGAGLAATVTGAGGTWVTVAMGELGQADNTFWQLFFRATGGSSWIDEVQATATATNGGLVEASNGNTVLVGVRPSGLLTFSPVIATSNGGRSWSNGLLPAGLTDHPETLALGPADQAIAVVSGRSGPQLVATAGGLTSWQTDAIPPAPPGCGALTVAAVAYSGPDPAVGLDCAAKDESVIEMRQNGIWTSTGDPVLGSAELATLYSDGDGLAALLTTRTTGGVQLVAAWRGTSGSTWQNSSDLALTPSARLVTAGAVAGGGLFVVTASAAGVQQLYSVTGPTADWTRLPPPPLDTAAVASGPGGALTALAPDASVMTIWNLSPGSTHWVRGQVINVPIAYGSSS